MIKGIPLLLIAIALVSCNNKELETAQNPVQNQNKEAVKQSSNSLDDLAINSLIGKRSHLKKSYVLNHYRFKTEQGEINFLSSLKSGAIKASKAKSLIWNYLENNISDLNHLYPYEEEKIHELLNSLPKKAIASTSLKAINYLIYGLPNDDKNSKYDLFKENINAITQRMKNNDDFHPFELEVVIKYLSKLYVEVHKDDNIAFDKVISLKSKSKNKTIRKIIRALHRSYYRNLLKKEHILDINSDNRNLSGGSVKHLDWNMSIHMFNGRCPGFNKKLNFTSIQDSWGKGCEYGGGDSTNTLVHLQAYIDSQKGFNGHEIEAYLLSDMKGGYADHGDENQTARLSYSVNGKGYIPPCNDVFKCNPFVVISRRPQNQISSGYEGFPHAPRKSKTKVLINGKTLSEGDRMVVDRSEERVKIQVRMGRNDTHVGACCKPGKGQQKLVLKINDVDNYFYSSRSGGLNFGFPGRPEGPILKTPGIVNNSEVLTRISNLVYKSPYSQNMSENYIGLRNSFEDLAKSWKKQFEYATSNDLDYKMLVYGVPKLLKKVMRSGQYDLSYEQRKFFNLFIKGISKKAKERVKGIVTSKINTLRDNIDYLPIDLVERIYEDLRAIVEKRADSDIDSIKEKIYDIKAERYISSNDEYAEKIDNVLSSSTTDKELLFSALEAINLIRANLIKASDNMTKDIELLNLELAQLEEL